MKDSGIEWIGEIPEGWEIIPVKYLAKYNYDTLAESCSPDFEFSYIDIGSVTYTDGITNYQNFKFKESSILVIFLFLPLEHTYAQLLVSMNTDCLK